jgi:anti-sigma regulatory factor (Ser/Thr protein kinase)
MKPREWVLKELKTKNTIRSKDIVNQFKISRQAAAKYLHDLVTSSVLEKRSSTRNASYSLIKTQENLKKRAFERVVLEKRSSTRNASYSLIKTQENLKKRAFERVYQKDGLEEDIAFEEFSLRLHLQKETSRQGFRIIQFAFTELLNNAIEHSQSSKILVRMEINLSVVQFEIIDEGLGVFENVKTGFNLPSQQEAAIHVSKGKQTTKPESHTGQGIFFTSRAADIFILESQGLLFGVDNPKNDVWLEDIKFKRKGTLVRFQLNGRCRRDLKDIFNQFTNEEFAFDKTEVNIKLVPKDQRYISRSEAKRLLFGLDQFQRIILNFEGVSAIGQGFADEVFRVFQKRHPNSLIEPKNTSPCVKFMIDRAQSEIK